MSLPVPHPRPGRRRPRAQRQDEEVYRVTTARTGLAEDQRARVRRYLISMSIRTVCFLGAVFTEGWVRWALIVGAVVLPYMAVIMANAGRENDPFTLPQADVDVREMGGDQRRGLEH